ncbi:heme NO-binding domain-containing protein [Ketobacter sp.]|uniref:heme NO-binding domain-containing protein n=1 Tax=Ketobacter sp. TaxID=2083498 RepID=UPI0025C20756|nr:heme NO-binding domain-containing protein [Ketobacter sp.]
MKGAVFIALQEMIMEEFDLDLWHQLLDAAGSDGVYTATLNYDDQAILDLVAALCTRLELSREDALRHFGRYLFGFLHRGYPVFADSKPDFFDFIASIDGVIHMEVMKLDDQARPPKIEVHPHPAGGIQLFYSSERNLCHLAEGLLQGAADHFGIAIEIEQVCCRLQGADRCEFRINQA